MDCAHQGWASSGLVRVVAATTLTGQRASFKAQVGGLLTGSQHRAGTDQAVARGSSHAHRQAGRGTGTEAEAAKSVPDPTCPGTGCPMGPGGPSGNRIACSGPAAP